jgi:ribosome assembly protein YihI (activator of Der GTPase)
MDKDDFLGSLLGSIDTNVDRTLEKKRKNDYTADFLHNAKKVYFATNDSTNYTNDSAEYDAPPSTAAESSSQNQTNDDQADELFDAFFMDEVLTNFDHLWVDKDADTLENTMIEPEDSEDESEDGYSETEDEDETMNDVSLVDEGRNEYQT